MVRGRRSLLRVYAAFCIILVALHHVAHAQRQAAPYGPNGRVITNTASDVAAMATTWNRSWDELIRILDEATSNHTNARHWLECDPAVLDFSAGNLAEAGKDVSAVKGFLFRNFTGSKAQRSAIASLPKVDSKDQLIASVTVDGLSPPQYFNLTSMTYASTAPMRLVGHKLDGSVIEGDPTTGSVVATEVPDKWQGLWQLDFVAATPADASIGLSIGKLEAQLCTFKVGANETYGTPPLQETLRSIGVLPNGVGRGETNSPTASATALGPQLPDMNPQMRQAIREQARAVATAGSVIPHALTSQVGELGSAVAAVANTVEPTVPQLQMPNAPVPEALQVAGRGINTAIKAAVTGGGAGLPSREIPFPFPTMTPASAAGSRSVVSGSTTSTTTTKASVPAPAPVPESSKSKDEAEAEAAATEEAAAPVPSSSDDEAPSEP